MKNTCNNNYFFLLILFVVTIFFASATAYAQDDKTGEIDKIFSFAKPGTPGCAVAVSQNGKQIVNRVYGSADLERGVPISADSVFDIGSAHKQFVAASILLLAEDGKLSLSDDIHKYVSELPDYGQKITIDNLLTHTSGIRDWTGLLPLAGGNTDALTMILRQRGLNFAPGEEWSYSNSGFVLLKEVVARASGMPFAEFARKRIFEPLGMKSTSYSVDMLDIIKNRALAYEKEGDRLKISMRLDTNRGGGGILSTTGDLLIWNDALTGGRLGAFVTGKLHEPAKLNNGRLLKYARGLINEIYKGGVKEISHSGGSAGYSTWLGRFPEHNLSVAVMCNVDPISASDLAHRVADLFLPTPKKVESDGPPPLIPEGIDVSNRTGLFFNEQTGDSMQLVIDRGRFRVAGGPVFTVLSKDRFKLWGSYLFFMSQDEIELNFLSPDEFELKSMEGKTTRYRRAQPFAPTADDLKAFAGRFESTEIGTVFQIEPKANALVLRLENTPSKSLELKPVDRDTFQIARMTVRFNRDKSGKVVSLNYSNPVVSKIKLTRLGDCK